VLNGLGAPQHGGGPTAAQAAYNLAVLYLTGKHVKQDIPKAMKLFKRAEERDRRLVAPDEQTARGMP